VIGLFLTVTSLQIQRNEQLSHGYVIEVDRGGISFDIAIGGKDIGSPSKRRMKDYQFTVKSAS
jgi:hypothetical protein